jgi:hypothetical protein
LFVKVVVLPVLTADQSTQKHCCIAKNDLDYWMKVERKSLALARLFAWTNEQDC